MYEETTAGQAGGQDSSEEDEDEQKEPPSEPTRFGWVQGVMVGGGDFSAAVFELGAILNLQICKVKMVSLDLRLKVSKVAFVFQKILSSLQLHST